MLTNHKHGNVLIIRNAIPCQSKCDSFSAQARCKCLCVCGSAMNGSNFYSADNPSTFSLAYTRACDVNSMRCLFILRHPSLCIQYVFNALCLMCVCVCTVCMLHSFDFETCSFQVAQHIQCNIRFCSLSLRPFIVSIPSIHLWVGFIAFSLSSVTSLIQAFGWLHLFVVSI